MSVVCNVPKLLKHCVLALLRKGLKDIFPMSNLYAGKTCCRRSVRVGCITRLKTGGSGAKVSVIYPEGPNRISGVRMSRRVFEHSLPLVRWLGMRREIPRRLSYGYMTLAVTVTLFLGSCNYVQWRVSTWLW
jgi:hypothetical protein